MIGAEHYLFCFDFHDSKRRRPCRACLLHERWMRLLPWKVHPKPMSRCSAGVIPCIIIFVFVGIAMLAKGPRGRECAQRGAIERGKQKWTNGIPLKLMLRMFGQFRLQGSYRGKTKSYFVSAIYPMVCPYTHNIHFVFYTGCSCHTR